MQDTLLPSGYERKIKTVMRFSGPRMLFYHPIMAIRHLIGNNKGIRGVHTLRMPEDRTMPCSCVELCDKNLEPFRSL